MQTIPIKLYAIANKKDVDIYNKLRILLQSDKDYIILVDDANRQLPNLLQILGLLGESSPGKLRLIDLRPIYRCSLTRIRINKA
jgi:hypothetical protein